MIGGRSIAGFTVNGTSPGPEIRVRQGQLVEVHLRNESVSDGVDAALARGRRPERHGRCRGGDSRRGADRG